VAERFVSYPEIASVVAHGETKCTVVLRSGVQVDLRIVEPETWGAALVYFTGSKAHNIALRTRALKRKLKISEYGVFRGDTRVAGDTEESVYRSLSLPWVAPELREDRGELDAAAAHALPELLELADIRGDLHVHTSDSDGASSLAEMVAAARARGYEYLAITDHSPAARIAGGMDAAAFRKQARAIERLREAAAGLTVLRGAEVDILADGRLDLDDEMLDELDVVIAAVHSKMDMSEAEMTERVLRAIRNPHVTLLAHPTGRLIGRREPYAIDLQRVVREARELGVLLELNAHPERLDLNDVYVRMARDAGAMLVVSTDAHRASELGSMRYGVDQARRGWCTAGDVANTRSLRQLKRVLRARTPRREPSKSLVHHGHVQRP
ncbi:MAG TPA: DNA polymerase/3'-5' exonuclease PolX, partial [Polyangiaceae bacterium]|nr:DNA polymerase/3'-5' exonuclease PolX [Polyangiaceae bacterium]